MKLNLGKRWERFITDQITSGRFQNQSAVVRDALRLMEQREIDQFDAVFADYPGAPTGEPSDRDLAAIQAAVKAYRSGRRQKQAA